MTERTHSRYNPGSDPHATHGVAIGDMKRVVHLLRLRKGREFTAQQIFRHKQFLRAYIYRYWGYRANADGPVIVPEIDSLSVQHMRTKESGDDFIAMAYTVTVGWPGPFQCLAASFASGDDERPDFDPMAIIAMAQQAAAQYGHGPRFDLPSIEDDEDEAPLPN